MRGYITMGKDKYKCIEIDESTGKPDGKKDVPPDKGLPGDDDLCFIKFTDITEKIFLFECSPTDECKGKNKKINEKKQKLLDQIEEQKTIIKDPHKAKKDKKKAVREKAELEAKLKKFEPECLLEFKTAAGGDNKPKERLTLDEINEKKIHYIFCRCQEVKDPLEQKYIKIDKATGIPEYLKDKDADGKGFPKDLCYVTFTMVPIPKPGKGETIEVSGVEFECSPTKECNKTNEEINEKKKELMDQIDDQDIIIEDQSKSKKDKDTAKERKAELKAKLNKFEPECFLQYFYAAGVDDKDKEIKRTKILPLDEIKNKIEYVYCRCQKVKDPEPPTKK
jgi:hypothetical protein